MTIAVLASGNLGLHCLKYISDNANVVCVFTDSRSLSIIQYCTQHKIPLFKGNPRNDKAIAFIKNYSVDIIFSINYLFIIGQEIIAWPKSFAFNIHGSLLPKYRGRTPHVWAIINNEVKAGLTVHLIDDGCDTGPIVLQKEISLDNDITGAEVLYQYEKLYPVAVKETLSLAANNLINPVIQEHDKATYFGVRTPEDGRINWNWQKERIKNWIRAQAAPYPGAFFFYEEEKIITNKCTFTDTGFSDEDKNGKILEFGKGWLIIKTSNGAIRLEQLIHYENINFTIGQIVD